MECMKYSPFGRDERSLKLSPDDVQMLLGRRASGAAGIHGKKSKDRRNEKRRAIDQDRSAG